MSELEWPEEFDRTNPSSRIPYPHNFQVDTREALENVVDELERFNNVEQIRVETKHTTLTKDVSGGGGMDMKTTSGKHGDPGVVAYWKQDGEEYAAPCDRWDSLRDNAQAIYHYLDAKRGIERWGVETVESEFAPQRREKRRIED